MEQMRIKHNETGRSMVEMLGVLAIMGVLSIGGVAGYRYAVDKMNANEIINELKKRAITASQQRVLGQNINLSEYGAILGKYEVTPANDYPEDPAFFGLEIKAVPQKVCQHIVDSDWALPTEMKIGNLIMDRDTECPDEFNDMIFAFNNTLGSGDFGNGETPDVTTEATTEVRATETEVSETDEIWTELDETATETEVTETESTITQTEATESDEIWTDLDETATETEVTETISEPEESVSKEEGLCPSGQFFNMCGYSCSSCSTSYVLLATAEECAKCDDTSTPRVMSSGGYCVLPCESGKVLSAYGSCVSPCDSGKVMSPGGNCVSPCEGGQFMDSSGNCRSCSYSSRISTTAEECAKCDDTTTPRTMYGSSCGLKSCLSGQFMDKYGACTSCSTSSIVSTTAEECAKCDNTSTPRVLSSGGYCVLPCESGKVLSANGNCVSPCGSGQFMSTNGSCNSCSDSSSYSATAAECAKCDDTSTPRTMYGNYCGWKSCPSGQFMDINGGCNSCSASYYGKYATAEECAKCDDTSTPWFMSGSVCYSCSYSYSVSTTAAECAKCGDVRYMSGSSCKKR